VPTKRTRSTRKLAALGLPETIHLTHGDCYLGNGCLLCDAIDGPDSALPRALRVEYARSIWKRNRSEILADWYEQQDGAVPALPAFGEVIFDARPIPTDPPGSWSEQMRRWHHEIVANAEALREWLKK
jgi:hypothetical protein